MNIKKKNNKEIQKAHKLISDLLHEAKRKKWGKDYKKIQSERMAKLREAKAKKRLANIENLKK
jgi:hypothetical protein